MYDNRIITFLKFIPQKGYKPIGIVKHKRVLIGRALVDVNKSTARPTPAPLHPDYQITRYTHAQ